MNGHLACWCPYAPKSKDSMLYPWPPGRDRGRNEMTQSWQDLIIYRVSDVWQYARHISNPGRFTFNVIGGGVGVGVGGGWGGGWGGGGGGLGLGGGIWGGCCSVCWQCFVHRTLTLAIRERLSQAKMGLCEAVPEFVFWYVVIILSRPCIFRFEKLIWRLPKQI